jgi:hypothetical protein
VTRGDRRWRDRRAGVGDAIGGRSIGHGEEGRRDAQAERGGGASLSGARDRSVAVLGLKGRRVAATIDGSGK